MFLYRQPEFLNTINLIIAPTIFGYSIALVLGASFLFVLILAWAWYRFYHKRPLPVSWIIVIITIWWAPLGVQVIYNAFSEIGETWFLFNRPASEQVMWRHCRIDRAQRLGGGLCLVTDFVAKVQTAIPKGSSVALAQSTFNPYVTLELARYYQLVGEPSQADYVIVYFSNDRYFIIDNILYYVKAGNPFPPERLEDASQIGTFELFEEIGRNQAIFKKL